MNFQHLDLVVGGGKKKIILADRNVVTGENIKRCEIKKKKKKLLPIYVKIIIKGSPCIHVDNAECKSASLISLLLICLTLPNQFHSGLCGLLDTIKMWHTSLV